MRLFIAVNFDEEFTGRILEIQERLRALAAKGNFSRRGNLHLTLVFLGETNAGFVPAIRDAIAAFPSPGPFSVIFDRAGCFRRSGKELWYISAVPGSPGLEKLLELRAGLVKRIEAVAAPAPPRFPANGEALSFDRRPFNAHITLGRELRLKAELAPFPVQLESPVRRVSLMQSEHRDGRLVYTELFGRNL
ncbi:MAG: 2'-5' RNA ligase family protein [Spirochaetaceae bacterium]|jgi:2'-5' RNA ligase|nr:2'-5' RNA ligase family protein [Spirochaetaceae bacterium]